MNQRAFLMAFGGMIFILNSFAVSSASAAQKEAVREWLERMIQTVETQNYRGTVVYLREDKIETLRVLHRIENGVVHERVYSLNGAQREVLRHRDEVRCLFPDNQSLVLKGQHAPRLIPELSTGLAEDSGEGYRFSLAGTDRVAGFETQIIEIFPLDEYRYGYRLWLEMDTGMLLRSALLDSAGRIQQQLMFTHMELGAQIADAELQPVRPDMEYRHATASPSPQIDQDETVQASWMPASLPPGFRLKAVKRSQESDGFEHLLFTDGFASFSVYVEPGDDTSTAGGLETVGTVNLYTRPREKMLITVVGEVPASTVQEIGRQLRPVQ